MSALLLAAVLVTPIPVAKDLPAAPWVVAGDESWRTGPAFFTLTETNVAIRARGWLGMTEEELRVRVEVEDTVHWNDQTGNMIWHGDFLRVSVDAWGDGTGNEPADTANGFGPDDASIGLALSSKAGSAGWVFNSRNPALRDAYPAELLDFRRDEATKTTIYNMRLPWKLVGTAAGLTPQFGISVIVRSANAADDQNVEHLRWGGSESAFQPGKFMRVRPGQPPRDTVAAVVLRPELWTPSLPVLAQVAVATAKPQTLTITAGKETKRLQVTGPQRYRIEYVPTAGAETAPLRVEVRPAGTKLTVTPVLPGRVIEELAARVEELLRTSPHPLFTRHLLSVKALVTTEWTRTVTEAGRNTTPASEVREFAEKILGGLRGDAGRWESYCRDGLPLCLAFTSKTDGTLQRYLLTLPKDWRAEHHRYPLFVELHGASHPNPLAAMAQQYDPVEPPTPRRTFASVQRAGYHVMPHGRGNLGYKGVGEADVWEALEDFSQNFRCDENRQYLYGFSMGGGGTWRLATRTPDRWAAVAIYAPGIIWRGAPPWVVAENLRSLPVWMWTGEADGLIKDQRLAEAEMRRYGIAPVVQSTPGVSHEYLWDKQETGVNWLQQFTRQRPATFSFVADTDEHRGIWGVEMKRDVTLSGLPRFECRVEGNTVLLASTGTRGLGANLGDGGLGLTGEVVVIWNGAETYHGPAKKIEIKVSE